MKQSVYAAADIGATGIKMVSALYETEQLQIQDICFTDNPPSVMNGSSYADVPLMLEAIRTGLRRFSKAYRCVSLGIDTYGNGYGILDEAGTVIQQPHHYRDCRIDGVMNQVHAYYSDWQLYREMGNFPVKTRGLFHLYQDVLEQTPGILRGTCLLPLSNLLEYLITGQKAAERTISSVLYLLQQDAGNWNFQVSERLGIPRRLFGPLTDSGVIRGTIQQSFLPAEHLCGIPVAAVAGHDTESALLAAPGLDESKVFVSLGTSFIFGTRVNKPLINKKTYDCRFKNMAGAFGNYSLCKDFPGFWILERCMEQWKKCDPGLDYDKICRLAEASGSSASFIDVDSDRFRVFSGNIGQVINEVCRENGQPPPSGIGATARCLFESYALCLKWNLDCLEAITGKRYDGMVAVGSVK